MIKLAPFSAGLSVIALQLNQPASVETLKAYHADFEGLTDSVEWEEFCKHAARSFGWTFIPKCPELFDALRQFRGEPSKAQGDHRIAAEAGEAYERVMGAGIYRPEGGTTWNYRHVVEVCGRAAGEAFMAAGGPEAFRVTDEKWNHDKRRNAFLAAYQHTAREEPTSRLLPPGDQPKQLTAGEQGDPQLTAGEAKGLLEKLREIIPADIPAAPKADAFAVNASEERYRTIQEQAARLKAEAETAEVKS